MKFHLPIYVHAAKDPDSEIMGYACRPLFDSQPSCFDVNLSRAMSKLAKRYKPRLDALGESNKHEPLLDAVFNPELETRLLRLRLDLTTRIERTRLLFVMMRRLDRYIAFSPSLPDVWFELASQELLEERAREVLTDYFRRAIREAKRTNAEVAIPRLPGQAWVASLDIDVAVRQKYTAEDRNPFAALWEDKAINGASELNRVGRCLDWLYPDGLKHAVYREDELSRLQAAVESGVNRPIAIVGPRLCGKTSIIHEHIRRLVSRRRSPFSGKSWHWLISPQRLISGMSYVGQWESRLLAIVRECRRRGHTLIFDNFLGLFEAGKTSCSELSVADVLRGHILRRQLNIITEMNSDQWAALQERDRGLADQFQVIRVEATGEEDTLRILLKEQRELEFEFGCEFELDAIPAIIEVHRRYDRLAAFPGKAAGFMRRLVSRSKRVLETQGRNQAVSQVIDAPTAYMSFSRATGVSFDLLNPYVPLTRDNAISKLESRIIGQPEGVDAAVDALMLAKAGLNDPAKPIATLLFLGPTGVGKTQCAKALAGAMFSDESKLIRFDMNEYGGYAGAARLIGSRHDPDGLLTAAVRRQPYAVILLDEIEKAHRDVFDLLLQVLGEGRLTDSRGRTADFTNTVIVMTSNLGVREAGRSVGWQAIDEERRHAYEKAARRFFRPEFFNRIDRIVPFSPLSKESMRRILELALDELLKREGLVSRRASVSVSGEALEHLVRQGYHPKLGARALKRTVESDLGGPMARELAKLGRDSATLIVVDRVEHSLDATAFPFVDAERLPTRRTPEVEPLLAALTACCERLREQFESVRPTGSVSAGGLTREQLNYFAMSEQLQVVRDHVETLRQQRQNSAIQARRMPSLPASHREFHSADRDRSRGERRAGYEIAEYHDESRTPDSSSSLSPEDAIRQACYLQALWDHREAADRVLLITRPLSLVDHSIYNYLHGALRSALEERLGYDFELVDLEGQMAAGPLPLNAQVFSIGGVGVWPLLTGEAGTHLFDTTWGRVAPHRLEVIPCEAGRELDTLLEHETSRQQREWCARRDPRERTERLRPQPVVRKYYMGVEIVDCRTNRTVSWRNASLHEQWADLMLDALPLPAELAPLLLAEDDS